MLNTHPMKKNVIKKYMFSQAAKKRFQLNYKTLLRLKTSDFAPFMALQPPQERFSRTRE